MEGRRGLDSNLSGPRLPRTVPRGPEDIGDPADGEKVARCLTCGSPTATITGTFVPDRTQQYAGRPFRYRLCLRCIEHANGPQDPDPLYVDAA